MSVAAVGTGSSGLNYACMLWTGKTTLLRHVLENSTEKIACIVNDVAAINIDAKLVRNDKNRGSNNTTADLTDTIELANGCACELRTGRRGGGLQGASRNLRNESNMTS